MIIVKTVAVEDHFMSAAVLLTEQPELPVSGLSVSDSQIADKFGSFHSSRNWFDRECCHQLFRLTYWPLGDVAVIF